MRFVTVLVENYSCFYTLPGNGSFGKEAARRIIAMTRSAGSPTTMTMNPIECPQASPRSYFLLLGRSGLLLYPTLVLLALVATACQEPPEETATETASGTVSVWIDTDPSVAPGGREVDDGLALIQAFHSDELDIRGVSIVFGHAPLEEAFPIGQGIVQRFGPEGLEVHSGAESRDQLG